MTSSEHPQRGGRGEMRSSWRTEPSLLVEIHFSPAASPFGGRGFSGRWQGPGSSTGNRGLGTSSSSQLGRSHHRHPPVLSPKSLSALFPMFLHPHKDYHYPFGYN